MFERRGLLSKMNLLPTPRLLKLLRGTFMLPEQKPLAAIKVVRSNSAPNHPEGYTLTISQNGIEIHSAKLAACGQASPRCGKFSANTDGGCPASRFATGRISHVAACCTSRRKLRVP
jgi:hypothetical protein